MATPSFTNGILMRDVAYNASSHVDSYHLLNQMKDQTPDDMGVIDLWAMKQKVEMPLYSMASFNGKNVQEVEDLQGRWQWQLPIVNDLPYSVEDMTPGNTTKGVDGQTFEIKMSRREFGKGEIITYDKYSGVELYIVPEADIISAGDHTIYKVQLVNNDNVRFLDNQFLAGGTKYFRVGSARGEYGQTWADMNVRAGFRQFYNFLPTGEAHATYSVSERARIMLDGGINYGVADANFVTEIWQNTDKNVDPSVTDLNSMVSVMGAEYVKKARAAGTLNMSYLNRLDSRHIAKVGKDIENYLMWGKGGRIRQDGPDDIRMSPGLWKQLDTAFLRIYTRGTFSLDMFRTELYNFFNGKKEFDGPNPGWSLKVKAGIAGMKMIGDVILKEANALGWQIRADKGGTGVITGDAMGLKFGYAFTEVVIPFYGTLQFELEPSFDNVNNNSIENPTIDGFPLSSYSFIIWDITETPNNIFLKKAKGNGGEFKWHYENGTMDYFGKTRGFASSGKFNGYEVRMGQRYPAIWVRDPTKILKIVMKNPTTGGHL